MRFWIRDAAGELHDGVNILGSGGIVRTKERVQVAIKRATAGEPLPIHESKPGHALGFYSKWWGRACERDVDLRGAELVRAADEPLPDIPPPREVP